MTVIRCELIQPCAPCVSVMLGLASIFRSFGLGARVGVVVRAAHMSQGLGTLGFDRELQG